MYENFLRHSDSFLCFRQAPGYLRRSLTFCGVLRPSEAFRCIPSCSERLLNVQKCIITLQEDLRRSCGF